jgi:hypothetical protein
MPQSDIFTFLTVYYKYGDWSQEEFKTLRDGLNNFLEEYTCSDEAEREELRGLPDDDLLKQLLKLG